MEATYNFKAYKADFNNQRFIISEDLPEVGWYIYAIDDSGNCTADYLQNTYEIALDCAEEEFGVPKNIWTAMDKSDWPDWL